MGLLALLLAAVAAGCNAFSSVMQRKVNREQQPDQAFRLQMVVRLVRQPAWLAGFAAMIASFGLQATALSLGTLASVEPVLVVELPLTLFASSWLLGHRLHRRDWVSGVAMAAGLAMFILALHPSGGHAARVSTLVSGLAAAATIGGVAVLLLTGRFGPDRSRAALFGAGAGATFGLTASLMKVAVARLSAGGLGGLVGAWESYGVLAFGVAGVLATQAALHAGTLVAAQPGLTLMDPLVAVLWGTALLGETTRTGPILLLALAGGTVIVGAVIALSRGSTAH